MFQTFNVRALWLIAAFTLIGVDTLTTAVAIETGLGIEGNPLLAPIAINGQWIILASLKTAVLVAVWAVWRFSERGTAHRLVPTYAAAVGVLVSVSNLAMIWIGVTVA